jgi:hypothetical protein
MTFDELSPEARALLARARNGERGPNARELRRIRNNVVLGVAPAGLLLGATEAAAAGKLTVLSLLGMAAKGAVLGTAVALGGYAVQRSGSEPAPVHVPPAASSNARERGPAPRRREPSPAAMDIVPPAAPSARSTPSSTFTSSGAVGKAEPSTATPALSADRSTSTGAMPLSAELLEEVETLRRVQEHLRAGRGAEALRVLDASASRLGQGQLRQERLAAEVFAACQSAQLERARQAARRFLQENPATPSAARLKTSCIGGELALP